VFGASLRPIEALRPRIDSWFAAPLLDKVPTHQRRWIVACLLALLVACAYVSLVVINDNTNIGTSNGLWKSTEVSAWMHATGLPIDSGDILYPAVYGRLAWLIPDSFLQYGTHSPNVTFRKMAILNAVFGGIASGLIFLLAARCTGSAWAAALIALIHAGAGFVLLNGINSEDIIPAYTLFLASTVCFFEFLYRGGIARYLGSALLLALATLFHWTVMVPALASVGAVFAILLFHGRRWFVLGAAWLLAFLVWMQTVVLMAFPHRLIPIWAVVYPEKANAAGWVGLLRQKGWYVLAGTGNYFTGAANVTDFKAAFRIPFIRQQMQISWAVLGIALIACLAALLYPRVRTGLKLLAISGLALFLVGELGAAYAQPQDPQLQIQPMLIVVEGLILAAAGVLALPRRFWRFVLAVSLILAAAANAKYNCGRLLVDRGDDSRELAAVEEISHLFPKGKAIIVWHGWEAWVTWQYVLFWPRDFHQFARDNVLLTGPFAGQRGISSAAAVAMVEKQIDSGFAQGRRVVASPVWVTPEDNIAASLATVTEESTALSYLQQLKKHYRSGTQWKTALGTFTELLPPAASRRDPLPGDIRLADLGLPGLPLVVMVQ
jgi:hypothetical protein